MGSRCAELTGLTAMLLLMACAHVTNAPMCGGKACDYDASARSTYRFAPKADKDALVIVTLSGGGARAAALAFGTLQMMDELEGVAGENADASASLLDQVDIISSVSGGSVMAGWYALKGKAALAPTSISREPNLWSFLNTNWMGELLWKGLNPWSLVRYTFTSYQRSDVLSDFYVKHLFGDATYEAVLAKYRIDPHQPYVILNATDLGHEMIFPFTQGHFDLLCADLGKYRLADAVAASSNFPLAFSPLGLENYSGCAAQRSAPWTTAGPPQWVKHYEEFNGDNLKTPLSIQLNQLRGARMAHDFLHSPETGDSDKYVHLLDGGVTDNLGIRSTLAIEDDPARVPSLYLRLSGSKRPAGYQNIQKVLYVVVNARTRDPGDMDKRKAPSGEIKTALHMVDTQLDASTLTDQDYLTAELESMTKGLTGSSNANEPNSCDRVKPFLSCKPEAQAFLQGPKDRLQFYVVSVDFEMIPDKECRDRAWHLKTNWGLPKHQAEDLASLAKVILTNSPELRRFYKDSNLDPKVLKTSRSFKDVCASLAAHS
jgi:NTE family protein